MTPPDSHRIMAAIDATWPPAEYLEVGPWLLRRGNGGGQRVAAASTTSSRSASSGPRHANRTRRQSSSV